MNLKRCILLSIIIYVIAYTIGYSNVFFSIKMPLDLIASYVIYIVIFGVIPFRYFLNKDAKKEEYLGKIYILAMFIRVLIAFYRLSTSLYDIAIAIFFVLYLVDLYFYTSKKDQYKDKIKPLSMLSFILYVGIFIYRNINIIMYAPNQLINNIVSDVAFTIYILLTLVYFIKTTKSTTKKKSTTK